MKATLLFIFAFLFQVSYSQAYQPMLNNSAWNVMMASFGGPTYYSIIQEGTVSINGYTYQKFTDPIFSTDMYLREDVAGKKVYKIINGVDALMFDFNLQLSNINVNGGQRRKFVLTRTSGFGYDEVWIEGVGNGEHPLMARFEYFSDPVFYLQCSFQNSVAIYNQGLANGGTPTDCSSLGNQQFQLTKISAYPNPFTDQVTVSSKEDLTDCNYVIYNLMGQSVKTGNHNGSTTLTIHNDGLQPGVYYLQVVNEDHRFQIVKIVVAN
jgi:hypothetical protein